MTAHPKYYNNVMVTLHSNLVENTSPVNHTIFFILYYKMEERGKKVQFSH